MAMSTQAEKDEAAERLREILKPGDTVYCILRHVSRSGMQRRISLYTLHDGEPRWLDGYAARESVAFGLYCALKARHVYPRTDEEDR